MGERPLEPVISHEKFFPNGVTVIDSVNASEISSVTMTAHKPYTNRDSDEKYWTIRIKLKNGSETSARFSNNEEASEAHKLIHSLHFRSMTFIYVIKTRSTKTFISDIITNNSIILEEAIKYLD